MTFDITKKWRWLVALGAVFVPAIVTGAGPSVKVPHKFSAGSAIKAKDMNDNISSLKKAIDGKGAVASTALGTLAIDGLSETLAFRRFSHKLSIEGDVTGGGGGGAAKAVVGDIEISFPLGNLSPTLNLSVNRGNHFRNADIAMGNLFIRLDDVILTSITADDVVDGVPLQELGIGFGRIEWTWQAPGQPARQVSYDRVANTGSGGTDPDVQYAFFGVGVTPNPNFIGITGYVTDQRCPTPVDPGGGTGGCKVGHSPFGVTKTAVGAHLLDDLAAVTRGVHLQSADIQWQQAGSGGTVVIQHRTRLEDLLVTSVDISTGTEGDLTESLGMTYAKIQWTVGSNQAGWDVAGNRPF
jgi:type VI protein secretion system component Hcp